MYTIGEMAKKFGLSRSTLLYYDRLGLVRPAARAANGYRLYDGQQANWLERIARYREAGIALTDIRRLLAMEDSGGGNAILIERLKRIQAEIGRLKAQEKLVLAVLRENVAGGNAVAYTRKTWAELLTSLGYSREDWLAWHREFETDSPASHHRFLKSLQLSEADIDRLLAEIKTEKSERS